MAPFFSIIIPTLNEEKFLPKLLFCLAAQKEKDFEILVVDGKSDDQTLAKAREFEKNFNKKFKILISSKRNAAYQRNLGAKKAKGDYLVFFDADVAIGAGFLERVKKQLMKKKSLLATTWVEVDEKGLFASFLKLFVILMVEVGRKIGKPFAPGFNMIIKQEAFSKIGGFDQEIKLADDYDFILRAREKGIKLEVFRQPRLTFSLRRFRREGKMRTLWLYAKIFTYYFFKRPGTQEKFSYPMGGENKLKDKNDAIKNRYSRKEREKK